MNRFRLAFVLTLCAVIPMSLMLGCDDDDDGSTSNGPPVTGTLNGNVIFHGDWPDSGTVQLSIFTNWNNEGTGCYWCATSAGGPPAYWTVASHFEDPDPDNLSDADTLEFEITGITLGDYEVVVTGWRSPTQGGNVECDEPVIGMYGAVPGTADTIPDPIAFAEDAPIQTIELHTWFERRLPVPGCDEYGRIEGTVDLEGDWPEPGVAAILTTMPYSAWQTGGIAGYVGRFAMESADDPYFIFSPAYGDYYISLWTNEMPPNNRYLGAWGVATAAHDARPDMISITVDDPAVTLTDVPGMNPPPHYIAGNVTFNGTRPTEGLLVMLTTFPLAPPTFPPIGAPSSMFGILDDAETLYAHSGMADGTYYVSLWNFEQNPPDQIFYAAYDPDEDGTPDGLELSAGTIGHLDIDLSYTAP